MNFDWPLQSNTAFFPKELVHANVILRPPADGDFHAWSALRRDSRADLIRWEDDWPASALGRKAYRKRLRSFEAAAKRASGLAFFIFVGDERQLVGGITLSNLRFGASCSGVLGYWIGSPHTRRGYGASAVTCLTIYAFENLGLNRIEAACDPDNDASRSLLRRCGYQFEGLAIDYLKINGNWRDHEIFAAVASRWRPEASAVAEKAK